ncbi:MAG: SusC/RagA family TonB-linked outer membrane protein [Chitinophaga sp.]|uniref:SusC/RagA family TonB-linked outer membrane protein n=1 Tax=Chitinophaga sp. TaxID=1869181 RepID=UPI001B07C349|nr:SusC/RagA family TonB-linked outer membrane protein [Chitinophaga sp.]MBO9732106.1 SusC/RagA family TonB-linked outer membrane protein [Chitinophaga sp.]
MQLSTYCNQERVVLTNRWFINQMLRVMKLSAIIILVCCLHISARSYSQKITFTGSKIKLEKVLEAVEKQTGFVALYDEDVLKNAHPVTITATQQPLETFLKEVFKDQSLGFTIKNTSIIISRKAIQPVPVLPPSLSVPPVKGIVRSTDGSPLPGVSVRVMGSNKGTVTDANGKFTITVKENDLLNITYLGFRPVTAAVNASGALMLVVDGERVTGKALLNTADGVIILLEADPTQLDAVTVNTGYQQISKERSAGSFSNPDMGVIRDRGTSMNILQRIEGLVPGLVVNNSPNAVREGTTFQIRGLSTINADKNPLYVVDGMPVNDVSSINPQDVESISVLKDATAASIWGARASNGVIVITTKKGEVNERLSVNYDGFISFRGKPDFGYFPVLNSQQYIQAAKETFDPVNRPYGAATTYDPSNGSSTGLSPDRQILYDMYRGVLTATQGNAKLDSLAHIDNRSQIKDMYRPARLTNHTLSVAGGSGKYAFYGSLAYTGTTDNTPGNTNNVYKVNTRQDFKFNKHLKVFLLADITNTVSASNRAVSPDARFLPYQLFKDGSGKSIDMPYMGYLSEEARAAMQASSKINLNYNPIDDAHTGETKSNGLLTRINTGVTINLLKDLQFEGMYGYVKGNTRTTMYDDNTNYSQRVQVVNFTEVPTSSNIPVYHLPTTGGQYRLINANQDNWVVRNQLIYDHNWKKGLHQLTAMAGQEAQEQKSIYNSNQQYGYDQRLQTYSLVDYQLLASTGVPAPVMPSSPNGSILNTDSIFNQKEVMSRFTSWYLNAAYTYNRKYSLNASWRRDQSNLFGKNKAAQSKPVWSVGGKWDICNEPFFEAVRGVNNLALRATYGITGISPIPGSAASFDVLTAINAANAPGGKALYVSAPANPNLTWESTKTINIGIDFAFLGERLTGSVDVYRKKTSNLLGSVPVNPLTGFTTLFGNAGDITNKGIELTLSTGNILTKKFKWITMLTMSYNQNKIDKLVQQFPYTTGQQMINSANYVEGHPAFALWAYDFAGLDHMGDPQVKLNDKSVTKDPVGVKAGDVVYMGVYQQPWSGGLSNIFIYKAFSLNINIVYNLGNKMFRDVNRTYTGYSFIQAQNFTTGNLHADFADRWKQPGDEAHTSIPSFVSTQENYSRRNTDYYIYGNNNVVDASYAKIRDISLSYTLPVAMVRKIHAEQLTFRFQVSNLMLWKANHNGIDPEFQDARFGYRAVMPVNQGAITFGAHLTL